MIKVENLVKWYGPTLAVDQLSFDIPAGQIVGFLGPNGAGKSTTLRILTGYLPPTSGRAMIGGFDSLLQSEQARSRIGYLPESNPLYPEMRVEEYLHFRGQLQNMERALRRQRIGVVCERCGLAAIRRRLIGQLSKGNRQRVGLAAALLHDPPVIVLDEPTAGLDPNQIQQFRQLINELRGKHTILLSTHILPEVEKTADQVLIIAGGRIVAQGSPDELRANVVSRSGLLVDVKAPADVVAAALRGIEGIASVESEAHGEWCRATVRELPGQDNREAVGNVIAAHGWVVREMRPQTGSLEQFFVQITQNQAQARAADPAA